MKWQLCTIRLLSLPSEGNGCAPQEAPRCLADDDGTILKSMPMPEGLAEVTIQFMNQPPFTLMVCPVM